MMKTLRYFFVAALAMVGMNAMADETVVYQESFDNTLGDFTTNDVNLDGLTYVWAKASGYAKASAYVSKTNHATESWLISPAIDLTGAADNVTLSFEHATNYFNTVDIAKEAVSAMITADDGATWTKLDIAYPTSMGWNFVEASASLASYIGKTIKFAFKYTSTAEVAGTWEVKNFIVKYGAADEDAKGGKNNPYTVAEIQAQDPDGITIEGKVWVKGFICGNVDTKTGNTIAEGDPVASNLALGATADATSVIPVQLPTGATRTALNVADNPENVGKEVLVYGDIQKYCTKAGVKNTNKYEFVGGTGIETVKATAAKNGVRYNMAGQVVDNSFKGLVIMNGKKFIQK